MVVNKVFVDVVLDLIDLVDSIHLNPILWPDFGV